jgi:chromosome segregation ATPase
MYDNDTLTNGDSLGWYQIGRSSGRWDAEHESSGQINGLISNINALQARLREYEAYLPAVTQNRDDAHKCAWALHHQLEEAKEAIAVLLKSSDKDWEFFKECRANSREALDRRQGLLDSVTQSRSQYGRFIEALAAAGGLLLDAAEAGKSKRQDYIELKALYQHMVDLWTRAKTDARDDPEFTRKVRALMESLIK